MQYKHLFLAVFIVYLAAHWWFKHPWSAAQGSPLTLGEEPSQEPMTHPLTKLFQRHDDISLLKLNYRYEITGEVLVASSYRWSFVNDYSEVDIGLAWGKQVPEIKKKIEYHQAARWLIWKAHQVLDEKALWDIKTHIGNIHVIPKEGHKDLDKAIHWISSGDIIRLRGYLVEIFGPSGELLMGSSTSRDDTGDGACEIMWVEELQIGSKIYR